MHKMWKVLIGVLMCVTTVLCSDGYDCNEENEGFRFPIYAMLCRAYFQCEDSHLVLLFCPKGKAFDGDAQACRNISLVYCPKEEPEEPVTPRNRLFARRPPYNTRVKRQISVNSLLETIVAFADPIIAQVLPVVKPVFIRQEDTVKNKIILPIIFDMLQDYETRQDLRRIFFMTKTAFRPIFLRMMRQQAFGAPRGTVIQIPREEISASKDTFNTNVRPLVRKVARKHWRAIFSRAAEHSDILLDAVDNLEEAAVPYAPELRQRIVDFMTKHGSLFATSSANLTNSDVKSYTLQEIKEDLAPIGRLIMEIFIDKMSREPRSVFSSFFSRNSVFYSLLSAGSHSDSSYQLDPRSNTNSSEPVVPALFNMMNQIVQA